MDFKISIIGIILILAFYLPGYFFRKMYFSGFSTKQFGMGEWYDRFFLSIFFGIIIQFVTLIILRDNLGFNFSSVSEPVTFIFNNFLENKLPDIDFINFGNALFYLFLSMLLGGVFGFFIRNVIRITKLDVHTSTFKYANIWHYYFRGDIVKAKDFKKSLNKSGKWVSTRADILLDFEKDKKNVLYSGIISQYDLSHKSDTLQRIYLTEARRYNSQEKRFKVIPGDILILDGNRIVNINLSYDYLARDNGKKTKFLTALGSILMLLLVLAPVVAIPYFLSGKIGLFLIVLGIIEACILIISLIVAVSISVTKKSVWAEKYGNKKWKSLGVVYTIIIVLVFSLKKTLFPALPFFQFIS